MAKLQLEVNYENVGALLKSEDMRNMVETLASGIANNAGEGYNHDTKVMGTRVIASAYTANKKALKDCLENNTLLKAVHP